VAEPPHPQPHLPAFPFAAQLFSGHLVGGFIGISRRDKPGLLLLPAATVAQLDLVYFHGDLPRDPIRGAFETGFVTRVWHFAAPLLVFLRASVRSPRDGRHRPIRNRVITMMIATCIDP